MAEATTADVQPFNRLCELPPELIMRILNSLTHAEDRNSMCASCAVLRDMVDSNCRRLTVCNNGACEDDVVRLARHLDVVRLARRFPLVSSLILKIRHRSRVQEWGPALTAGLPLLDDLSVGGFISGLDIRALLEPCADRLRRIELGNGCGVMDVDALAACRTLEVFHIYDFPMLADLSGCVALPLREVDISFCPSLSNIDAVVSAVASTLRKLRVFCCEGLTGCVTIAASALKDVEITMCGDYVRTIGGGGEGLRHLVRADVSGNQSLSDISTLLAEARALQQLDLRVTSVADLDCLATCVDLRRIDCGHSRVSNIDGLRCCPKLEYVSLVACSTVQHIGALQTCSASLQHLVLDDCGDVADLSPLVRCTTLRHVSLVKCVSVADISPLAASSATLQHLDLYMCKAICDISVVERFASLEYLNLHGCEGVRSIDALSGCRRLQFVDLARCAAVSNIDVLAGCRSLKELTVNGCTKIARIAGGSLAGTLERLSLRGTVIADVGCIARCTALRWLDIGRCKSLTDVRCCNGLASLKVLDMSFCESVSGVLDLSGCGALETLDVCHTSVTGIDPPASLETIDMSFTPIEDISTLRICDQLRTVTMLHCPSLSHYGVEVFCQSSGMFVVNKTNGMRMLWRKPGEDAVIVVDA